MDQVHLYGSRLGFVSEGYLEVIEWIVLDGYGILHMLTSHEDENLRTHMSYAHPPQ